MGAAGGRALVVFAKEPVPGAVKTRLARELGPERAARLYEAMLLDTLASCRRVDAALAIAFAPPEARPYFERVADGALLVPQAEGDLGARLRAAFEEAFARGFAPVIALGSDAPQLEAGLLESAFERLAHGGAVAGPSLDGGYTLIGLAGACPALFEGIDWSTSRVLAQTRERAARAGLELALLSPSFDVDEPADLQRMRELLASRPDLSPRTARALGLEQRGG